MCGADPPRCTGITTERRAPWQGLRIFVPRVTWVEADGTRRPLVYESDVLSLLPWHELNAERLAADWAPSPLTTGGTHPPVDRP